MRFPRCSALFAHLAPQVGTRPADAEMPGRSAIASMDYELFW